VRYVLLLFTLASAADADWRLAVGFGTAFSLPTRLAIRQQGEPDISLTARYDTRPLAEVPYYDIRVERYDRAGAWELELVHHKLYLKNRPAEVAMFEITHGYNLIVANRSVVLRGFDLRFGAGMVLAHPETEIRGRKFDETRGILGTGWYASGVAAQAASGRRFRLGEHWSVGVEAKLTGALARVPVVDGTADVPNIALHVQLGGGYRF